MKPNQIKFEDQVAFAFIICRNDKYLFSLTILCFVLRREEKTLQFIWNVFLILYISAPFWLPHTRAWTHDRMKVECTVAAQPVHLLSILDFFQPLTTTIVAIYTF